MFICVSSIPFFLSFGDLMQQIEPLACHVAAMRLFLCRGPAIAAASTTNNSSAGSPIHGSGHAEALTATACTSYGCLLRMACANTAAALRRELNLRPISALARESLFVSFVRVDGPSGDAFAFIESNNGEVPCLGGLPAGARFNLQLLLDSMGSGGNQPNSSPLANGSFYGPFTTAKSVTNNKGQTRSSSCDQAHSAAHDVCEASAVRSSSVPEGCALISDGAARCTICLDSLSEAPAVTTVCGHVFHVSCLAKCEETPCPLCRYDLSLVQSKLRCGDCHMETDDLWMCLVCGSVLCGRLTNRHAALHYTLTRHTHAVQIGSMRVWDYLTDSYVHRLLSTDDGLGFASSGKGTPAMAWADEDDELERATLASKTEYVAQFYSRLLQQQLELQAQHYVGRIEATQNALTAGELARGESMSRNRVIAECLAGYRQLTSDMRVGALAVTRRMRERQRRVQQDLEMLAATTTSVQESIHKVMLLTRSSAAKRITAVEAKRKQIAALKLEMEALFSSLA
jgi:hypothetical protein